jgi:RNA polymerase sigma-70 factor (ECF subfamily)
MATILPLRKEISGPAWALEDDDALLDRIRGDDEQAYRVLVERHIDRAYGLALRILRSASDAEDVTQDAFIKTWQHRHDWQPGRAKFSTWLYRVVVNRAIDLQRRPRGQAIDSVPEPLDEADDAVTAIHKRQMSSQLEDALARLPPQQRTALALSYWEDLGNAEVASVMGTTVEAVESLLKRGRQRLRTLLKRNAQDLRE